MEGDLAREALTPRQRASPTPLTAMRVGHRGATWAESSSVFVQVVRTAIRDQRNELTWPH